MGRGPLVALAIRFTSERGYPLSVTVLVAFDLGMKLDSTSEPHRRFLGVLSESMEGCRLLGVLALLSGSARFCALHVLFCIRRPVKLVFFLLMPLRLLREYHSFLLFPGTASTHSYVSSLCY